MFVLYKPLGLTPLQAIEKFRENSVDYRGKTLSYAGRLDPMAEGLLLVLIDEENKKRREYEHMDKTYEFEAVLGVRTDSYDLLGIPKLGGKRNNNTIEGFVKENVGKITQRPPLYSAIKVNGKPLYYWARRNIKVNVPTSRVLVKNLKRVEERVVLSKEIRAIVRKRVMIVDGDFRQEEIVDSWERLFSAISKSFILVKFEVRCAAGVYVRSIVESLGVYLGCGAATYSIKRTEIDKFTLRDAILI